MAGVVRDFVVMVEWSGDGDVHACSVCRAPLLRGCGIYSEDCRGRVSEYCERCSVQLCLVAGGGCVGEFLAFMVEHRAA